MEKFGIFELLDALSAITAQNDSVPPAEPAPPKQPDGAFDPPAYESGPAAKTGGQEALAGFLARHDAVARKAEKKHPNAPSP